jgi:anaerobic magnesium-protoporphyrin IX monomethyl ester cyclase
MIWNKAMKQLRIALVEAVSGLTHVYSRTYLPRVGIATLGAILKNIGYHCDVWIKPMSDEDRTRLIEYDVVGIGSLSSTIAEAYALSDYLRKNGTTVIMGGPHVTFMPNEAMDHCDYVVMGEGENVLPALLKMIENKEQPNGIKGVAYRKSDGSLQKGDKAELVNYAYLPSPDFLLSPQISKETIPPIIVTSRGCPHDCSFCSVTALFGRRYRFKNNDQVISELRPIQHKSVCFGDDNFCANPVRTKALLREMIKQDAVPLRWSGQMCVNAASDKELLELMQETRCRIMYVGVESVNPETLKKYGKVHNVDAVRQCVENLHKHDIGIHGMFVVDSNDEPDAASKIVDYAIAVDMDTIQVFSVTPFPGTRAFEDNKDNIIHTQWAKYDGMHVVVKPSKCSAHIMQQAIVDEMKRFYSLKRAFTAYRKNRGWRLKYRFGGNLLIRQWVKENAEYMDNLKTGSFSLT